MRRLEVVPLARRPLVSAVVPCYNYGHYLPAAVRALLDQEGVDVEVIIVEDKSPDDSLDVARRLEAADPRVRVIAHAVNGGLVRTANDGIAASTGDYVLLISADDIIAPGALARAAALLDAEPEVVLVYGAVQEFVDEPPVPLDGPTTWRTWGGEEWVSLLVRRGWNLIHSPEAVVRGEIARAMPYDPRLPYSSDLHMWIRVAAYGRVGRIGGPTQAFYRRHGDNMSAAIDDLRTADEAASAYELAFGDPDVTARLRRSTALRRSALDAIGIQVLQRAISIRDAQRGLVVDDAAVDGMIEFVGRIAPRLLDGGLGCRYRASERGAVGRVRRHLHLRAQQYRRRRLLRHFESVTRRGY